MRLLAACFWTCVLLASGCRREEVTHYRVAKGAALAPAPSPAPMAGAVAPPPTPTNALRWTLPKGWTQTLVGGMRYATLRPPGAPVDVSVVTLPGPAGGELANVNRWRGQLGLPPIDEASLAAVRKELKTKAGALSLYDFTGEGEKKSRMVAGLLVAGGNSWFVKMVGDAGAVASARPEFVHLLQSLHFD